jgi:hypothetical protein
VGSRCSAGKEITCSLWNLKVSDCVHARLSLDPILSQLIVCPVCCIFLELVFSGEEQSSCQRIDSHPRLLVRLEDNLINCLYVTAYLTYSHLFISLFSLSSLVSTLL